MDFAFWFAPAAAFAICIARSNLGRAAVAWIGSASSILLAGTRSFAIIPKRRAPAVALRN
jgi:hypothetical protein